MNVNINGYCLTAVPAVACATEAFCVTLLLQTCANSAAQGWYFDALAWPGGVDGGYSSAVYRPFINTLTGFCLTAAEPSAPGSPIYLLQCGSAGGQGAVNGVPGRQIWVTGSTQMWNNENIYPNIQVSTPNYTDPGIAINLGQTYPSLLLTCASAFR